VRGAIRPRAGLFLGPFSLRGNEPVVISILRTAEEFVSEPNASALQARKFSICSKHVAHDVGAPLVGALSSALPTGWAGTRPAPTALVVASAALRYHLGSTHRQRKRHAMSQRGRSRTRGAFHR
jgi:hypothetical protein